MYFSLWHLKRRGYGAERLAAEAVNASRHNGEHRIAVIVYQHLEDTAFYEQTRPLQRVDLPASTPFPPHGELCLSGLPALAQTTGVRALAVLSPEIQAVADDPSFPPLPTTPTSYLQLVSLC